MSCDEAVVKKMGDDILADYTASLLSLATGKTIIAGIPLAFGEGDTKGRIRNLAHWKKPTFVVVLVAVIACVVLGIGLLTNPEKDDTTAHNEDGYYLLIGAEAVDSIEVEAPNFSSGVIHAGGAAFKKGEKVWLEPLQGITDLRGVRITALGAEGKIIYEFWVPEDFVDEQIADMVASDPWLLVPTTFKVTGDNFATEENTQIDDVASAESMSAEDTLPEESTAVAVKWTYSLMMSATQDVAFMFNLGLENYSHIEALSNNGILWNPQTGEKAETEKMWFEQGEPLCWMSTREEENVTNVAASAFITFTIYDGEEVVSRGALDIAQIEEENGQVFYEAQMTDTELLALQQEADSNEAYIVLAGNGNIVSYFDLNHNRINERIVVREVEADMIYELLVVENGTIIWSIEAGLPHAGWNTIMLYNDDGKDYLVEYRPQMYQGVGTYKCRIFSLEGGREKIEKEWAVDFELSSEEALEMATPEMEQFAEEVGFIL